ncbi:3-dehydroquinate synthase [Alicyclobacillus shizuokensis]|uniref:3-dehydroquinate synthase n=1 Tax=Alicyclobacillus shizuokensis TaxID=392014 RepID=UPI00083394A4|nr:3-dehydroquinate synthase [Alicyclobacillus shizuokensis]
MTTRLEVHTPTRTYPFVVAPGLHRRLGDELKRLDVSTDRSLFLITDETVAGLGVLNRVSEACQEAGYSVASSIVPPGDSSKSWATAYHLYQQMLQARVRRDGVVVAIGGGMVGDLAGFVAATYLRGVSFVQVPTTLLAHDSSIGGKVGVNLPEGKNLVGAFHQPLAVLYDTECLASLPTDQWRAGMAEVIKHGIIGDAELFARLESSPVPQFPGAGPTERLIARAAAVKIRVVEADERESGLRMVLNVGHTVGHAVEQISAYRFSHGEAVAMGLCVEAELSVLRGLLSKPGRDRIVKVLAQHGLPTQVPDYSLETVISVLDRDKKNLHHGWTFALPVEIGRVEVVRGIGPEDLKAAWNARLHTA